MPYTAVTSAYYSKIINKANKNKPEGKRGFDILNN